MNPLSPNTPPAFFRIFSTSDPSSFAMSCRLPVTGSETNVMRPCRFATTRDPCPVVLYFPDHSLLSPSQDQHGHNVPSTQCDRVPGGLRRVLCRRPVFFCRLLDKWREERDVPRYRRLVDVEDIGPDILDDILPHIAAGNDERLPQG